MVKNSPNRLPIRQNQYNRPQYQQFQTNFQSSWPYEIKVQAKPVPMEIYHAQQTRAVNYMSRPNFNRFAGKRPPLPSRPLVTNKSSQFNEYTHFQLICRKGTTTIQPFKQQLPEQIPSNQPYCKRYQRK